MQTKTNKILLVKPSWPKNDEFWQCWNSLRNFLISEYPEYSIQELSVSHGLSGKGVTERFIKNNHKKYSLIISYHTISGDMAVMNYKNVIDYKGSYYNNLWYFGNKGYSGFSDLAKRDFLSKVSKHINYDFFYNNSIKPLISKTKYVNDNLKDLEHNIPNDFLFVPLQVENDTVMKLKEISSIEMIARVMQVGNIKKIPVVIKFHPKGSKNALKLKIEELSKKYSADVYISNGDVRKLISGARATFVINSGVGFESLINLKRVFSFGKSDYQQATHYNCDVNEIINILDKGVDKLKIKQFLYHWFEEIIDFTNNDFEKKIKEKISVCLRE